MVGVAVRDWATRSERKHLSVVPPPSWRASFCVSGMSLPFVGVCVHGKAYDATMHFKLMSRRGHGPLFFGLARLFSALPEPKLKAVGSSFTRPPQNKKMRITNHGTTELRTSREPHSIISAQLSHHGFVA